MGKTILEILGVMDREDTITNMLQYGIENNPTFATKFMALLTNKNGEASFSDVSALTRMKVKKGVPDLIVSGIGPEGPVIVVVENKIKAGEGKDQTSNYFEAKEEIRTKLKKSRQDIQFDQPQVIFVFLTLNPYDKPAEGNFVRIDYDRLLKELGDEPLGDNEVLNLLWKEFVEAVRNYYLAGKLSENDSILEKWTKSGDGPLGESFLYFTKSFREMELGQELVIGPVFKSKAWGVPSYQTIIYKPHWRYPEEDIAKDDLTRGLGYSIHFEPTLKEKGKGKAELHLFLHFEHREYRSAKEEKKIAIKHNNWINEYEAMRETFKQIFTAGEIPGLKIRGGRNQIGVSVMDLDKNMSLSEFATKLMVRLSPLAEKVDSWLKD